MADQHLLADHPNNNKPPQNKEEEEDTISKIIGNYGRWQFKLTFLLSLFNICCTFHIFVPTFLSLKRDVWCGRPPQFKDVSPSVWRNYTQPDGECTMYDIWKYNITPDNLSSVASIPGIELVKCKDWEFEGSERTLISEFNLVCDRRTLDNLAGMMFLAGVAIGGLVCGIISDKYGRKKTLMGSVIIQTIIGVTLAFTPWFELYIILRAILGFISVSVVFSGFVLSIEIVGGKWRTIAGICYLFPVSVSYMITAGIAYFLRDWHYLQLAVSLPGCLYLILWWVLPESPRWLLAMGNVSEVVKVLQSAVKANGRELPSNIDKQLTVSVAETNKSGDSEKVSVLDLFRTSQMRKKTFLLLMVWFSMYLVYYGLVLNLNSIGGNIYVNTVIFGLVEIPAIVFSIIILLKGGRKLPLALTIIVAGVAGLCNVIVTLAVPNLQWPLTVNSIISKLSISSSNVILPIFTAELFPTTIRNIGVGASNVSAGIALMLVPYLWELEYIQNSVPWAMIGGVSLIGGLCVLFLPETANRPLVHTLKEQRRVTVTNTRELQNMRNG